MPGLDQNQPHPWKPIGYGPISKLTIHIETRGWKKHSLVPEYKVGDRYQMQYLQTTIRPVNGSFHRWISRLIGQGCKWLLNQGLSNYTTLTYTLFFD
jgi:hypothetical protein